MLQSESRDDGGLCFAMGGGGARGAYQVGVLRHIARRHPALAVPLITGVSAGGINAAHLANHTGELPEKVEALVELWRSLTVEKVFRVDNWALAKGLLQWGVQLSLLGGRKWGPRVRGLVDTQPLREFLCNAFGCEEEKLAGVDENIRRGTLRAVALSTTSYSTGRTITWCQGAELQHWERPNRVGRPAKLEVAHVMASAALPLFFPAVQIDGNWYGDGGIRLHAPLAPSIHLGAERILAISTRYGRTIDEAELPNFSGYPPPAQVAGILMNAIFLDLLDQDAVQLERINRLLESLPQKTRGELRQVDILVVRPSVDLGKLASEYEPTLPGLFRFLTRRLGTRGSRSSDLLSLVMFQPDYIERLIEIGERDAAAQDEALEAFLRRSALTSSAGPPG
jgi:NTE family protein